MIIHIAGRKLGFGHFRRQLCAWCGHRLVDVDMRCIAWAGDFDGPGFWKEGELIGIDGPASFAVPHEDGSEIPPECCGFPPREAPQLRVVSAPEPEPKEEK